MRYVWYFLYWLLVGFVAACLGNMAHAHMKERPDLDNWFMSLHAKGGTWCCDFTEGTALTTDEWGMEGDHYWVIVHGQKIVVPDDKVITDPNKYGQAVVWPVESGYDDEGYRDPNAEPEKVYTKVRCFLPGAGT